MGRLLACTPERQTHRNTPAGATTLHPLGRLHSIKVATQLIGAICRRMKRRAHALLTMKALNRNQDFPEGCPMPGARAAVCRLIAAVAVPRCGPKARPVGGGW